MQRQQLFTYLKVDSGYNRIYLYILKAYWVNTKQNARERIFIDGTMRISTIQGVRCFAYNEINYRKCNTFQT